MTEFDQADVTTFPEDEDPLSLKGDRAPDENVTQETGDGDGDSV